MKNFLLGFFVCTTLCLVIIQVYLLWCPHARLQRDVYITNQMILPYDGFALRPFHTGPVFPYDNFPFILQDKDETIDKNKAIFPKFVE